MSGTITTTQPGSTNSTTGTTGTTSATGTTGSSSDPFASLSNNFSDFLQMLMTQLQNQDPTQPMDSSQFTTELVQFSGVEQQININNSLQQLISLTQGGEVEQSANLLGHKVAVSGTQMPLQNGSAGLQFNAAAAQPVSIVVTNAANAQVYATTVQAAQGSNSWSWNGTSSSGATLPDGTYSVSVTAQNSDGSTTALSFDPVGTVTGVVNSGSAVNLQLGSLATGFSNLAQVLN